MEKDSKRTCVVHIFAPIRFKYKGIPYDGDDAKAIKKALKLYEHDLYESRMDELIDIEPPAWMHCCHIAACEDPEDEYLFIVHPEDGYEGEDFGGFFQQLDLLHVNIPDQKPIVPLVNTTGLGCQIVHREKIAMRVVTKLIEAFAAGEDSRSIDWEDLNDAYALALEVVKGTSLNPEEGTNV